MGQEERIATVLDGYDCVVMADQIRIIIDSPRDPSLADIMSELYHSEGLMHFDGVYYEYNGSYAIDFDHVNNCWYLDLFYQFAR